MTTSENASVAPAEGTVKRSITMKNFRTKTTILRVSKASLAIAVGEKPRPGDEAVALGQIIGQIFKVDTKSGTLPNGEVKDSLVAVGEFEATNYETGEVFNSYAAYLPSYYLETVKSILDASAGQNAGIVFAVEIVLTATGKSVPTAYEVRNLVSRRPENPLNRIKAELASAGRLRLPPPPVAVLEALPGEKLTVDPADDPADEAAEAATLADDAAKPSPAEKGGKRS